MRIAKPDIRNWSEISTNFKEADLILGNGFSINFHEYFRYSSLFDLFLKDCSPEDATMFRKFNTANFELILEKLTAAREVNTILGLKTGSIERAIEKLKRGLLSAVHEAHPSFSAIDDEHLESVCTELNQFRDLFTANYDLLVYHLIMKVKDRHDANHDVRRYNDYFWKEFDRDYLQFMGFQNYRTYDHVYYLHGALFLYSHPHVDLKLRRRSDLELVERIEQTIRGGSFPLFVSEGTAEDKRIAIKRSRYLQFALDKLGQARKTVVVYGLSFAEADEHIVQALSRDPRSIAVSIYVDGRTDTDLKKEMYAVRGRLGEHQVVFFDSRTLFAPPP